MVVFISYSRHDIRWKNELLEELEERKPLLQFWHDGLIRHGDNWLGAIQDQLRQAGAAILLVSDRFLDSAFCREEVSDLLEEGRRRGLVVYPVLVSKADLGRASWVARLDILPKDRRLQPRPLDRMDQAQRREFWRDLCRRLAEVATADDATVMPELLTADARRHHADRLAGEYERRPDATLRRHVNAYMSLYTRGHLECAFDFLEQFERSLLRKGVKVEDRFHTAILTLLRVGPPIEPTHMEGLLNVTADSLLSNPGYPDLLLGIRKAEAHLSNAIDQVEASGPRGCALREYALGQWYRKHQQFHMAKSRLTVAHHLVEQWMSSHCPCGPMCARDGLMLSVLRGLGALHRELGDWEKADAYFRQAEGWATDDVPRAVRSDYFFGYGYSKYKYHVVRSQPPLDSLAAGGAEPRIDPQTREGLEDAHRLFDQSLALRPHWAAPRARQAIIRRLLGEFDGNAFLTARRFAQQEQNIEASLTAVNCAFAILVETIGKPADRKAYGLDSAKIRGELEGILGSKAMTIPQATLDCHAFDNRVILGARDIAQDDDLRAIHELLQRSCRAPKDA